MATDGTGIKIGGGKLYIAKKDSNGIWQKTYLCTTESIALSTQIDDLPHTNTEGSVGIEDLRVKTKNTVTLNFSTSDINKDVLVLATDGTKSAISQTASTVTAQNIAHVVLGNTYDVGKVDISSVVVKSSGGSTTYVENTDYTVDGKTGNITILTTGSITADSTIEVDYAYADFTGSKVSALTNCTLTDYRLILDQAVQTGDRERYTFYKANIKADGDFSLKDVENFVTINFTANVLQDTSRATGDQFYIIEDLPSDGTC